MLRLRPDLLLQSASSLAAKMDVLPAALGLPHRRVRDVLQTCPDLLRRCGEDAASGRGRGAYAWGLRSL